MMKYQKVASIGSPGGVSAISQGQVCVNPGFWSDFYDLCSFGYPFDIIQFNDVPVLGVISTIFPV